MDSGGLGVRRPVTQAACFSMASVLKMVISEPRTRILPVQDPLSASGAGLRYVVGQQILEVSCVGWKWVRTHTGEQSPVGLILTNPCHGDRNASGPLMPFQGAEAGVFRQLPEDGDGPGALGLGHVGEECRIVQSEFLDGVEITGSPQCLACLQDVTDVAGFADHPATAWPPRLAGTGPGWNVRSSPRTSF